MSNKEEEIPPIPDATGDDKKEEEKFFHPETGEPISKNAYKKLMKGGPVKKEKKEKPVVVEKKEKKAKVTKEPEIIIVDETPNGDKKIIDHDNFPPSYQPKYVEAAWQAWWEKEKYYAPNMERALKAEQENKFVMVIPPPNVTGSLHLGHALTTAIEDTVTRWHRMKGKVTLWVPGTDHAGIATQSIVEKKLKKDEGLSRHDLGREKFIERVWEWKGEYGNKITNQIRHLGASVDWEREAFTMDANCSAAVTEAFVRFHEQGLVYRSTRLINWSCALQSAISDIEVDFIDLEGRTFLQVPNHKLKATYEFGMMTSFAYKIFESPTNEEIIISTTRLETMLGDTAIAVHPDDPRYTHLHGKYVIHPFVDRKIKIITDGDLVDMNFGTGAVKITPAHDPNDYNCGKKNDLEFITVITEEGKIAPNMGKFSGMMRYDARIAMEEELEKLGLYHGKVVNKMRLGLCSRSNDIIEPMLSPQWYVNCNSMAQRSVDVVKSGELQILPKMHEETWYRWLDNIRDWCVSRQLWWGHRIPAYFARVTDEVPYINKNDPENVGRWIVARTEDAARTQAATKLGVSESQIELTQDEDVLDTWFSSGLFPFSVFGWPNNTDEMKAFYPTSLLETGLDILFFWVARMVMMGLQLTDMLPFKTVYLHAMVRDKNGRKMSKSLGNVIDPLEVINGCTLDDLYEKIEAGNLPAKEIIAAKKSQSEDFPDGIPECGADALRFGLLAYTVQGRDVNLDIKRVVGYRQFCNKLWNAVRFALAYLTDFVPFPNMHLNILKNAKISKRDLFILSKLNTTIRDTNNQVTVYEFGNATTSLYSFFLYDVCDFYLETVKNIMYDKTPENEETKRCAQITLYTVIEQFLRLCHPFMPFVTEDLWQRLPNINKLTDVPSIMISSYPEDNDFLIDLVTETATDVIRQTINSARSIRAEYKIASNIKVDYYFVSAEESVISALTSQEDDFCTLAKGNFLKKTELESAPKGCCVKVLSEHLTLLIELTGVIDLDQEIARLNKEIVRLEPLVASYARKCNADADVLDKLPEAVKIAQAEKLSTYENELAAVQEAIKSFEKMKL